MCKLKRNDTDELREQKETHRSWAHGCQREGVVREFEMDVYTLLRLKRVHHGPALQHMELCSRWCGSRAGREVWGRMDTRVYVAESLHCSPETITALLMGCTPVQNKKFERKHKNVQIVFFLPAFPNTHRSWSSEE